MTSDNCFQWSPNQNNQTFKNFILTAKTVIVVALVLLLYVLVLLLLVLSYFFRNHGNTKNWTCLNQLKVTLRRLIPNFCVRLINFEETNFELDWTIRHLIRITCAKVRCQFHQHLYVRIFHTNVILAAFSSYALALAKNLLYARV